MTPAFAKLRQSTKWPIGVTSSPLFPQFSSIFSEERIVRLIKDHDISTEEEAPFRDVLKLALLAFRLLKLRPPKMASLRKVRELQAALKKVSALLQREDMRQRVPEALLFGCRTIDGRVETIHSVYDKLNGAIDEFIPILTEAAAEDGRATKAAEHSKLHANIAAHTLHDFWVNTLHRGRSVQSRDGRHSPGLKFILDVIRCYDSTIKEASIRKFSSYPALRQESAGTIRLSEMQA